MNGNLRVGPIRPSGPIRHPACGRFWTGARTAHCALCHESFSGIHAFDAHQRVTGGILHCLSPDKAGLVPAGKPWGAMWSLPNNGATPWSENE